MVGDTLARRAGGRAAHHTSSPTPTTRSSCGAPGAAATSCGWRRAALAPRRRRLPVVRGPDRLRRRRLGAARCGFARPDPDGRAATARRVARPCEPTGRSPARFASRCPGRCNLANAAMAAVAAGRSGVDAADALAAHGERSRGRRPLTVRTFGGGARRLLLAKNPAGWAELLDMLGPAPPPVVIGINARIADGHDPSWLWDVPFERLAGRLVVATGERCHDLAVRLRYAGVDHVIVPTIWRRVAVAAAARAAADTARRSPSTSIANYTGVPGRTCDGTGSR